DPTAGVWRLRDGAGNLEDKSRSGLGCQMGQVLEQERVVTGRLWAAQGQRALIRSYRFGVFAGVDINFDGYRALPADGATRFVQIDVAGSSADSFHIDGALAAIKEAQDVGAANFRREIGQIDGDTERELLGFRSGSRAKCGNNGQRDAQRP